ncbi:MAG: RagB/SusD family nutrient uptake outer membrane protein [Chitinophagaceae bacterium]|nr:RagB/SusD family nutrient uptake outer membrane protein [Chitinophagaceae bacterium]
MQRITTYTRLFVLVSLLLTALGCKKFLEEKDLSNLTPDNFYTIPEHAEAGIAAVYAQLRSLYDATGIFSNNWQMLEAVSGTTTTESAENTNLNNLYSLVYDGYNLHVIQTWDSYYKIIAQANLVLDRVPGINPMDEGQKKKILGEAHFLRAWAYFAVVRLWGDAPLILNPQTASSEDFMPVRTSQEDIYTAIVADLLQAEVSGLPWTDVSGRVNMAAVKAQLARVYLTMAGYPLHKGTAYYQQAADKAYEVITYAEANPTQINLFPDYESLRNVDEENRLELLFSIQFKDITGGNPLNNYLPNGKPVTVFGGWTGTSVPTRSFYESFESGDKRVANQVGFFYTSYFTNGSGELFDLNGPYVFKYFNRAAFGTQGQPGTGRNDLNVMQLRYAEVLLLYAEAKNESELTQAAYNAYKKVRDRAALSTPAIGSFTQESFREAVWRERWHELCFEGISWYDMTRLRKVYNESTDGFDDFVGHINKSSNQALQSKHLLFPIPSQELLNNPNLGENNPGY